jgi:N-acetylmuramoyl-L-alanine amidase
MKNDDSIKIEGDFDGPVILNDPKEKGLYPVCEEDEISKPINSDIIVILDNGHGKETHGKRSPVWDDGTQLFEWEFNRDIAKRVYDLLEIRGYKPYILVPEDKDITLGERCRRANEIHSKQKSILVSVHANAGGGTGFEGWTTPGKTKSDDLCEFIYTSFGRNIPNLKLRKDKSDGDSDKEERFYILKNVVSPAVLLECAFMDTYSDCKFMMSDDGKILISKSISEGIMDYLKSI